MRHLTVRGCYLAWEDGTPFFYLADTAWELFHRLTREEIAVYFTTRAAQGFNAAQCVALAELEGVTTPNACGRLPLHFTDGLPDPTRPDTDGPDSYWDLVDDAVDMAAARGMFVTLLPTWGDKFNLLWGKGPVIFNPENAYIYGKWIGGRYADRENIIWMLGGDRPLEPAHRAIIDAMARGIREADPNHLMTFHTWGGHDSTDYLADADYIDFHTSQTGHKADRCYGPEKVMLKMMAASDKPCMDAEPRYEDIPACFGNPPGAGVLLGRRRHPPDRLLGSDDRRLRTYLRQPLHLEHDEGAGRPEALTHPGAAQMRYLRQLRLSHDYFSFRYAPELLAENYAGMGHLAAGRGKDYGYVYDPLGLAVTVRAEEFGDAAWLRAKWFDPRTGRETTFAILPTDGPTTLVPPTRGKGCDWVLILEEC